ncbi:MAG: DUF5655 domain-containing protein [Acidobacteriota bacterium]
MGHSVEQHFEGKSPHVRSAYNTIVAAARRFGPVEEDPKKTSIHLNRKSAFAGIQTRREFLILTVKSAGNIDDARISKREQAPAHRWHHEIKIAGCDDIDGQIIGWLRVSYDLSD